MFCMASLPPIFTAHLFSPLDEKLIALLRSLPPHDWSKPTVARLWTVKDIAAHLLDVNIRAASFLRDDHSTTTEPITNYADLVGFLNRLNAEWVLAMKRVSPQVLTDLLEQTGKWHSEVMNTLPPFEQAKFAVAWAGEEKSPNWFHVAREYTEKWHHQQQIRLAVGGDGGLLTRDFYFPFLETCFRALPYHYRNTTAETGASIEFVVEGTGGGSWLLLKVENQWQLVPEAGHPPDTRVIIPSVVAWRIFTKGIARQEAAELVTIEGDRTLGEPILSMLTVMA
jgi:uncharacterized protein (TIGR03083 family)